MAYTKYEHSRKAEIIFFLRQDIDVIVSRADIIQGWGKVIDTTTAIVKDVRCDITMYGWNPKTDEREYYTGFYKLSPRGEKWK